MRIKVVFYLLGRLLTLIAGCMLVPALVSLYFNEFQTMELFLFSSGTAFLTGMLMTFLLRGEKDGALGAREGFLLVTMAWLILSLFGALPFYLSEHFVSFIDAFFESVSGFTTTGATILSDVEVLSKGLLFWRDFTHWIGGMGIIVLAVAILPQLSVGGMQLMKNEMPGPTFEQLKPRIKQTALSLWKVYMLLSVLEVLTLHAFGMPLFDSLCHMFGTMGTGGFSTKNASIGAYSTSIQLTIAFFMFLAGANFVLHYALLKGQFKKIIQDSEWRFYVFLISVSFAVISIDLAAQGGYSLLNSMRLSIFQLLALITTTGYATADFDTWPHLSKGILFLLMFVGGCAGSTSGGLKQVRLLLLFKRARQSITQHILPKAIVSVKLNKRVIPESVLHGVSSLFLINIVIFSFVTCALLAYNIDFVTATTAVIACLMNVGPGFADVGASQNYGFLPGTIKCLLSFCMILGRLEVFTVLVLFFPMTWKR